MLTPLGVFLDALLTSAVTTVALPIIGIGFLIAGAIFVLGNSEHGKNRGIWTLVGGAIILMSRPLAVALQSGFPH
jgi:hypothetical protein